MKAEEDRLDKISSRNFASIYVDQPSWVPQLEYLFSVLVSIIVQKFYNFSCIDCVWFFET